MGKKLIYLFVALGLFVYGIAIGHYEVFPFSYIRGLKRNLVGYTPEGNVFDEGAVSHLPQLASKPANREYKPEESKNSPYWQRRVAQFTRLTSKPDVVMLGDSITEGAQWDEIFPNAKIINRGISGDTTAGVLERIDEIKGRRPKLVFLMIGINDLSNGVSLDKVYENYVEILRRLAEHNIQTVVQSTLYVGVNSTRGAKEVRMRNQQVRQLNSMLSSYCSDHGIIFVDLNKSLAPNGALEQELTWDGLHPNVDGYVIWANVIKDYVRDAARGKSASRRHSSAPPLAPRSLT